MGGMPIFVVQQHQATSLHFDFRLEVDGVLRSWAVPKGPSLDPAVKRLAVPVPDHAMSHAHHESANVIIWDEGDYDLAGLTDGNLSFTLHGTRLRGGFALTRTGPKQWLLVKKADEHAVRGGEVTAEQPGSVRDGRTL